MHSTSKFAMAVLIKCVVMQMPWSVRKRSQSCLLSIIWLAFASTHLCTESFTGTKAEKLPACDNMRHVQTSRESSQLHPCSSLSANFTKAKPLEEPSGNRLMSTLSTCSCFHLDPFGASFPASSRSGQCLRACKESWERSWEEIGLIRTNFHYFSLNPTVSTALNSKPSGDPAWPYFAKCPMTLSSLVLFRRPPTKTVVTSAPRSFNLEELLRSHETFFRLPTCHQYIVLVKRCQKPSEIGGRLPVFASMRKQYETISWPTEQARNKRNVLGCLALSSSLLGLCPATCENVELTGAMNLSIWMALSTNFASTNAVGLFHLVSSYA